MYKIVFLGFLLSFFANGFAQKKLIEIPLTFKKGIIHDFHSANQVYFYNESPEDPMKKTYLNVSGVPKDWTNVKYADIVTDMRQMAYQNHLLGNITDEIYQKFQERWEWKPDISKLSKEPIKVKIALAFGKDLEGKTRCVVDANNNLDFSDDKIFTPLDIVDYIKDRDLAIKNNTIEVSFERVINNQKVRIQAPLLIIYYESINIYVYSFAEYSEAKIEGETVNIHSYEDVSYNKSPIISYNENKIEKGKYIEIKGIIYKFVDVDINAPKLILEKTKLSKDNLYSLQKGFKAFPIVGKDLITGKEISTEKLKGKYILLDFWAVWCVPCIKEFPFLKKLYEETDRNKFEIIGIAGDSEEMAVRDRIEKNAISWPQIVSNDINNIIKTFDIKGYPKIYLLNPEGFIIEENLRGEKLEAKILELLK
ncbi:TlpA family protein disulfide reductase [Capnocytophaga cynodegmi]|uniref:TlpA family protein disulfide reductase n=1 Tax=Capnocytophaga cynodegmi TaxID=28189 RepID=UPI001BB3137A|nr:TlpA disulfide reductase family protein [Capnocytophaga cynodegmi]